MKVILNVWADKILLKPDSLTCIHRKIFLLTRFCFLPLTNIKIAHLTDIPLN